MAAERIRIQNTADATVYSTVNVFSRDINFIAYYDLKSDEQKDTGPNMVGILSKNSNSLKVQKTLDETDPNYNRSEIFKIEEKGGILQDKLYGLAKAETYFSRPKDLWSRNDGYREYGNLYNPFWQTRLIDITNKERLAAVAAAHLLN